LTRRSAAGINVARVSDARLLYCKPARPSCVRLNVAVIGLIGTAGACGYGKQ
jgi:hypothetical protein